MMDESAFGVVHKKYWGASHTNMTRPIKSFRKWRAKKQEEKYGPMSSSGLMGQAGKMKIDRSRRPYGDF